MKKLVSLVVLVGLTATSAMAAAPVRAKRFAGDYAERNRVVDVVERNKDSWYLGGRLDLNVMSWENKYSSDRVAAPGYDGDMTAGTDSYTEMLLGGNVFVGRTFNSVWRAELEAGLISQFEDVDSDYEFKITVPYLIANGYYDFANGFYVGAGLGVAMPKLELDGDFEPGDRSVYGVSFMGAAMAGWSYRLDARMSVDLRYRLAMVTGVDQERTLTDGFKFKNEVGMILDNSFSVGLRYKF